MNLKSIRNIIRLPSTHATGVLLNLKSNNEIEIALVDLFNKKDHLEVSQNHLFSDFESIKEHLNPDYPLYLSITGKGILHKKLKISENDNPSGLIHQIIPNAKIDQFYLQQSIANNQEFWVTIARKEVIDKEIEKLKACCIYIQDVVLGPFNLQSICNTMPETSNSTYLLNDQEIKLKNNFLEAINKSAIPSTIKYPFDDKNYSGNELLAIGAALQHFLPDLSIQTIQPELIIADQSEYYQRKLFKKLLPGVLGFFLLLLLVNFFVFDYYNNKLTNATSNINAQRSLVTELNNLQEEQSLLTDFIKQSGIQSTSHIAFYADQLASDLPDHITLTEMAINPRLEKKNKKVEVEEFQFQSIRIMGHTSQSLELNEWIKKIKAKFWTKEVVIVNYSNIENSGTNEFELLIETKKRDV